MGEGLPGRVRGGKGMGNHRCPRPLLRPEDFPTSPSLSPHPLPLKKGEGFPLRAKARQGTRGGWGWSASGK
jgi:hypothetical protein